MNLKDVNETLATGQIKNIDYLLTYLPTISSIGSNTNSTLVMTPNL